MALTLVLLFFTLHNERWRCETSSDTGHSQDASASQPKSVGIDPPDCKLRRSRPRKPPLFGSPLAAERGMWRAATARAILKAEPIAARTGTFRRLSPLAVA